MKYYMMAAAVLVIAAGAFFFAQKKTLSAHEEWRRVTMEPETKERPARFEDMKFKPVEVRMPASDADKKHD